jgi:hypothetical protein
MVSALIRVDQRKMAKNFLEVSQMVEEKLKVPDSYDYSE